MSMRIGVHVHTDGKVFSTGQVAKICNVAPRTVAHWFDTGRIKGYLVPGSRERRVPRANLIAFLRQYSMPLPPELDDTPPSVLFVSHDMLTVEGFRRELAALGSYVVRDAKSGFQAGMIAEAHPPVLSIVDCGIGMAETQGICRHLRAKSDAPNLVLLPSGDGWSMDRACVTETWRKPFDVALLAARVRTLTSTEAGR